MASHTFQTALRSSCSTVAVRTTCLSACSPFSMVFNIMDQVRQKEVARIQLQQQLRRVRHAMKGTHSAIGEQTPTDWSPGQSSCRSDDREGAVVAQVAALTCLLRDARLERDSLMEERDAVRGDMEELQESMSSVVAMVSLAQRERDVAIEERNVAQLNLVDMRQEMSVASEAFTSAEHGHASVIAQCNALQSNLATLQRAMADATESVATAQRERDVALEERDAVRLRLGDLQQQTSMSSKALAAAEHAHKSVVAESNALRFSLANLQCAMADATEAVAIAQRERDVALKERDAVHKELAASNAVGAVAKVHTGKTLESVAIQATMNQKSLTDLEQQLAAAMLNLSHMRDALEEAHTERDACQRDVLAVKELLARTHAQLDEVRQERGSAGTQFDNAEAEDDSALQGLMTLRAECDALRAERDAMTEQLSHAETQHKAALTNLAVTHEERLRASEAVDAAAAALAGLRTELSDMRESTRQSLLVIEQQVQEERDARDAARAAQIALHAELTQDDQPTWERDGDEMLAFASSMAVQLRRTVGDLCEDGCSQLSDTMQRVQELLDLTEQLQKSAHILGASLGSRSCMTESVQTCAAQKPIENGVHATSSIDCSTPLGSAQRPASRDGVTNVLVQSAESHGHACPEGNSVKQAATPAVLPGDALGLLRTASKLSSQVEEVHMRMSEFMR
eukprot:352800-Chlamydomonas_euryale.AAC.18